MDTGRRRRLGSETERTFLLCMMRRRMMLMMMGMTMPLPLPLTFARPSRGCLSVRCWICGGAALHRVYDWSCTNAVLCDDTVSLPTNNAAASAWRGTDFCSRSQGIRSCLPTCLPGCLPTVRCGTGGPSFVVPLSKGCQVTRRQPARALCIDPARVLLILTSIHT